MDYCRLPVTLVSFSEIICPTVFKNPNQTFGSIMQTPSVKQFGLVILAPSELQRTNGESHFYGASNASV